MVDRLIVKEGIRSRLFDSVEAALRLSDGYMNVDIIGGDMINFSEYYACPKCGFTVGEMEPRLFSFNAPFGACPDCDGLGVKLSVDEDLVVPDKSKTLAEGAIAPWKNSKYYGEMLEQACAALKIPFDKPFSKLTKKQKETILHGSTKKLNFMLLVILGSMILQHLLRVLWKTSKGAIIIRCPNLCVMLWANI